MALVRKTNRKVNEFSSFATSRKYSGKPIFKTTVQFENSKPKNVFSDGPNAYVQMCVENRGSTQDWWMTIEDLQEIAEACNEAINQLRPFVKPTLQEVK